MLLVCVCLVKSKIKKTKMLPHLLNLYNHNFSSWINGFQENDNHCAESHVPQSYVIQHPLSTFKRCTKSQVHSNADETLNKSFWENNFLALCIIICFVVITIYNVITIFMTNLWQGYYNFSLTYQLVSLASSTI